MARQPSAPDHRDASPGGYLPIKPIPAPEETPEKTPADPPPPEDDQAQGAAAGASNLAHDETRACAAHLGAEQQVLPAVLGRR